MQKRLKEMTMEEGKLEANPPALVLSKCIISKEFRHKPITKLIAYLMKFIVESSFHLIGTN